ncbi:MAG: hypothetical protein Q9159_003266 [Coniocarpon cinnabarinum]
MMPRNKRSQQHNQHFPGGFGRDSRTEVSNMNADAVLRPRETTGVTCDAVLPSVDLPHSDQEPNVALSFAAMDVFSVTTLAAGLKKCSIDSVLKYIRGYSKEDVKPRMNTELICNKHPVLFYAIARNETRIVSEMLQICDQQAGLAVHSKVGAVPPLAFAILHGGRAVLDTTEMVKVLLAFGAEAKTIPEDLWVDYIQRPRSIAPAGVRTHSQRCGAPLLCAFRMREMPFHLVGQAAAAKLVSNLAFSYIAGKKKKPLVMFFAGPSGHGTTEIAERLGDLLNVPSTVVDYAQICSIQQLLGPESGYSGWLQGSQLNNFLANNNGKRAVVFLDEFEKMPGELYQALLRMTDSGKIMDRRHGTSVSTINTIFILGTNLGDTFIERWFEQHLAHTSDAEIMETPIDGLTRGLRTVFRGTFGAPLTGRCSAIVPFMPFTRGEQAVVAASFVSKLFTHLRRPLDMCRNRLIGHIHLDVEKDEEVALTLAEDSYEPQLGARAIAQAVENQIEIKLHSIWKGHEGVITDDVNKGPLRRYVVEVMETADGKKIVEVAERGMTEAKFWATAK